MYNAFFPCCGVFFCVFEAHDVHHLFLFLFPLSSSPLSLSCSLPLLFSLLLSVVFRCLCCGRFFFVLCYCRLFLFCFVSLLLLLLLCCCCFCRRCSCCWWVLRVLERLFLVSGRFFFLLIYSVIQAIAE